jgi:predicted transcriptional regulator of viral defense system
MEALMAIRDYLNTHHVFNMQDFKGAFPGSVTDLNLLARAAKNGKVERVRSGLFVSRSQRFFDIEPSPCAIATKAVDDAVFCYMSALQLHGFLYNMVSFTQFFTCHRLSHFSYNDRTFVPLLAKGRFIESQQLATQQSGSFTVTTKEQTIVDCLARPGLAGGSENLLRSFATINYLDIGKTIELAVKANRSTCARLGWVLEARREEWGVSEDSLSVLRALLSAGPYYFYPAVSSADNHWVRTWSLYLPCPEQEMSAWLNA